MPRVKKETMQPSYLKTGIGFLRTAFDLPFYADRLQLLTENRQQHLIYNIPLRKNWFKANTLDTLPETLSNIHTILSEALIWTNLGKVEFKIETDKQTFPRHHSATSRADIMLIGLIQESDHTLDTFKSAMVLVLAIQLGLAAALQKQHVRYGNITLPLTTQVGEAIASILQTAADPMLSNLSQIAEHYTDAWCLGCMFFRHSAEMPETGYCDWARSSVTGFLSEMKYTDPLWRSFVTHPRLQTGLYDSSEREEATMQYRDRVAQWFDEEDQVTLDPITLHLVEDVLHAAKSEDELQDTDTVLPRALRLMDFWHSGYLPPSGESHPENPNLLTALDILPDAVLPLVLSALTVIPPQHTCVGFVPMEPMETEVASLQLGIKPLRDVLLQAIPRRVLELLASTLIAEGENINVKFMRYLHEQASISFERIMLDYEDNTMTWLFEPTDFHLTDVLYLHANLNAFVHDITMGVLRRIKQEQK